MRVAKRLFVFLLGVLAIAVLPFGVYAAESSALGSGSTVLRILQIVWLVGSIVSLGVVIYGFIQMRRVRDDVFEFERSKRLVFISGIALVICLLLFALITFFMSRSPKQSSIVKSPESFQIEGGFGDSLGPSSKIAQHYPLRDQRNVARNVSILVTFIEEVNGTSVGDGQGVLKKDAITIQQLQADDAPQGELTVAHVTVGEDKKTLKISPDELLGSSDEPSTKYKLTILSSVQNSQHTSMLGGTGTYSWVFYVGNTIDTDPPYVVSVFPVSGKDSSSRNSLVQMTFSKALDPTALKSSFIQLTDVKSQKPILGSVGIYNNYKTLMFTSDSVCGSNQCNERIFCLPVSDHISVRIKTATIKNPRDGSAPNLAATPPDGIVDTQGNSLDGGGEGGTKKDGIAQGTNEDDYIWSFSTNNNIDTTMPTIVSVIPGRNGSRVDRVAPIEIHFSKIMDLSTLNKSSIILDRGLQYSVDSDLDLEKKQTVSKILHDILKEDTTYSPEVNNQARDIYQNCFASCVGPLQ
ncbi:MAG: Ig-like domain-containing protein [bacterium]|nr:Ig-like domain-containing protein [bacterium]